MYSVLPPQYDTASLQTVTGAQVDHFPFFGDPVGRGGVVRGTERGRERLSDYTLAPATEGQLTCSIDVLEMG